MNKGLIILGSVIGLLALIFLANEFAIFGTRFWGVRQENAKREVFEKSQSYVEGKRQELTKYHHEWIIADSADKISIEYTIRSSFANFDEKQIESADLRDFLIKTRSK